MCFRPPTIETRKTCPECNFENVFESENVGGADICQQCSASLPMSDLESLQMKIAGGGAPSAPGSPKAPSAPGAPRPAGGPPKAPRQPGAPSAPSAPSAP